MPKVEKFSGIVNVRTPLVRLSSYKWINWDSPWKSRSPPDRNWNECSAEGYEINWFVELSEYRKGKSLEEKRRKLLVSTQCVQVNRRIVGSWNLLRSGGKIAEGRAERRVEEDEKGESRGCRRRRRNAAAAATSATRRRTPAAPAAATAAAISAGSRRSRD